MKKVTSKEVSTWLYQRIKRGPGRLLCLPIIDYDEKAKCVRHFTLKVSLEAGPTTHEMTMDMVKYIFSDAFTK